MSEFVQTRVRKTEIDYSRKWYVMAAVAMGRPAAAEGLPDDPRFVATLLVVREIMHHLDIPFIRLGDGGADAPDR